MEIVKGRGGVRGQGWAVSPVMAARSRACASTVRAACEPGEHVAQLCTHGLASLKLGLCRHEHPALQSREGIMRD